MQSLLQLVAVCVKAMPSYLRIRLNFSHFEVDVDQTWFLLDKERCKRVSDFHKQVKRKYKFLHGCEIICILCGYIIPKEERIEIIRDEDEITIEDGSFKNKK